MGSDSTNDFDNKQLFEQLNKDRMDYIESLQYNMYARIRKFYKKEDIDKALTRFDSIFTKLKNSSKSNIKELVEF